MLRQYNTMNPINLFVILVIGAGLGIVASSSSGSDGGHDDSPPAKAKTKKHKKKKNKRDRKKSMKNKDGSSGGVVYLRSIESGKYRTIRFGSGDTMGMVKQRLLADKRLSVNNHTVTIYFGGRAINGVNAASNYNKEHLTYEIKKK